MERLIQELQARRLDRIAVGYAVGGWILVQAASIVLPTFDAPVWVLRAFIMFVLMGFPLSLVIGWFAVPYLPGAENSGRPLNRTHAALAAFAAIVVVVVGDLAYQLSHGSEGARGPEPAVTQSPAKTSIAVLPFVNMSGDPAKEYFSDGISEELLNDLANIPALFVAARTSSFAFKGKNEDIKDIARILAVHSVLEGSVRESGRHLRITAQLIDAADGYHLWSATYDRDLTDVLAVQDEIAQAITAALTHKLLPAPVPKKSREIDPQAYRNYLLGQHELGPRTQQGAQNALILFQQATALAPEFAEGFAALARAQINVAEFHPERRDLLPAAEAALTKALSLDPGNVSALSSRLDLSLHRLDWVAASADAHRMQSINANSAAVLHEMFRYYQLLGFPDLALAAAQGAAKLNPLSFVDRLNVAAALIHNARFAEAATAARSALALEPDQPFILSMLCTGAAHSGDLKTARAIAAKFEAAHDDSNAQSCQFDIAVGEGRLADARRFLDRLAANFDRGDVAAADLGDNYALAGDFKQAVHWLLRAYDLKEFALFTIPYDRALPSAFFETPDWKALVGRPLFDDWRKEHARVTAELAVR